MRRFPAPPVPSVGGGGLGLTTAVPPSTPGGARSAEAPMQYEWERPRQFPASLFATPKHDDSGDGERARKRTHYEAMDVDTPPTATVASDAAARRPPPLLEPLEFDAKRDFDRPGALGLHDDELDEVVMADNAEDLVVEPPSRADDDDHLALIAATSTGGGSRRRSRGKKTGPPAAAVTIETDDEEDDDEEHSEDRTARGGQGSGFLGTLQKQLGQRGNRRGEFSFQVHHHHAAAQPNLAAVSNAVPERWLQSNTPYVLLGYLQFGSLTLFAVLVLSLLVLFLYTLYTDIQSRLSSLTVELRSEILQCAKAYVDNRCEPATRIPAMERRCSEWEECMNRDVVVVGKTRVVAETLAEIVNGFVDVISFKTMLFVLLTLGITIYGSSAALSLLATRASDRHNPTSNPHGGGGGGPHFYPPPYGLPYSAGQTPWVIDDGTGGNLGRLGLGGPSGESRDKVRKFS